MGRNVDIDVYGPRFVIRNDQTKTYVIVLGSKDKVSSTYKKYLKDGLHFVAILFDSQIQLYRYDKEKDDLFVIPTVTRLSIQKLVTDLLNNPQINKIIPQELR